MGFVYQYYSGHRKQFRELATVLQFAIIGDLLGLDAHLLLPVLVLLLEACTQRRKGLWARRKFRTLDSFTDEESKE